MDRLERPTVSVIVTTHSWGRYGAFRDALRSLERQTYSEVEIVCPVDADADMATATEAIADGGAPLSATYHPDGGGLATARNRGAKQATGDVYAFLDDDCVAAERWVERLVVAYEDGALAAGGPAMPVWPDSRPWYLPEQFDWLIGGGPYHETPQEVRNTYGCNISFRADVFDHLGGFDPGFGKDSGNLDQAEETELCRRLQREYGEGVWYCPDAVVDHRVFPEQLSVGHLLRRAFMQGRAKRRLGLDDEETGFLAEVLRGLPRQAPQRSLASLVLTAATGAGYVTASAPLKITARSNV